MTDGKPIFLSYSSTDRERATELHERLVADGFEVFLDQEDLVAGQSWSEDLDAALNACKVLVLCATNRSLESRMVAKELKLADERDKTIIPVFLQNLDDDVQSKVAWQLAGQQGLFLFGPAKEVAYGKLVKGIEAAGVLRGEVVPQRPVQTSITARLGPPILFVALLALLGTWAYFNVISTLAAGGAQVAAVVGLALLAPMVRYVVRARSQRETESFADAYRNSFRALLAGRALAVLLLITLLLVSFVTSVEVHASERGNKVRVVAGNSYDPDQLLLELDSKESRRQMKVTLPFTSFTAFDAEGNPMDEATSMVLPIVGGSIQLTFVPTVFVILPTSERDYLPDGSSVRLFGSKMSAEGERGGEECLGEWPTDGLPVVRFGPPAVPSGERSGDSEIEADWQSARECLFTDERVGDLDPGHVRELFAAPGTMLRAEFLTPEQPAAAAVVHTETQAFLAAGEFGVVAKLASKVAPWPTVLVKVDSEDDDAAQLEGLAGLKERAFFRIFLGGDEPIDLATGGASCLRLGRPDPTPEKYGEPVDTPVPLRLEADSTIRVDLMLENPTDRVATAEFEVGDESGVQLVSLRMVSEEEE